MFDESLFKKVKIKNRRYLYISTYFFKYDKDLKKNKIITRIVFKDRIKLYDLQFLLDQQTLSIEKFLEDNKEYTLKNSIFHLVIQMDKGASFTPDLNAFRVFMRYKLGITSESKIVFGPTIGILPRIYIKFLTLINKGYFGLVKGVDYDIVSTYEDAELRISDFKKIISKDNFPEHIIEQLKSITLLLIFSTLLLCLTMQHCCIYNHAT